jgi:hypothetical protein
MEMGKDEKKARKLVLLRLQFELIDLLEIASSPEDHRSLAMTEF